MTKLLTAPLLAILLCHLLTACSLSPQMSQSSSASQPLKQPGEYSALAYYQWVTSADSTSRQAEQRRLEAMDSQKLDSIPRIQLALLWSLPGATSADARSRTKQLLTSLKPAASPSSREQGYRTLAKLWGLVLEREEEYRQTQSQVETLKQELELLKTENELLHEQINALTSIEEQMMQRESSEASDDP